MIKEFEIEESTFTSVITTTIVVSLMMILSVTVVIFVDLVGLYEIAPEWGGPKVILWVFFTIIATQLVKRMRVPMGGSESYEIIVPSGTREILVDGYFEYSPNNLTKLVDSGSSGRVVNTVLSLQVALNKSAPFVLKRENEDRVEYSVRTYSRVLWSKIITEDITICIDTQDNKSKMRDALAQINDRKINDLKKIGPGVVD